MNGHVKLDSGDACSINEYMHAVLFVMYTFTIGPTVSTPDSAKCLQTSKRRLLSAYTVQREGCRVPTKLTKKNAAVLFFFKKANF